MKKGLVRSVTISNFVILLLSILFLLFFRMAKVNGISMEPTLYEGDWLFTAKFGWSEGDIVLIDAPGDMLIKRLVAKGLSEVSVADDGGVSIDGVSWGYDRHGDGVAFKCGEWGVPDGKWFVLGDNRMWSQDSRYDSIGCFDDSQIYSRVLFRVWPLSRFGIVR